MGAVAGAAWTIAAAATVASADAWLSRGWRSPDALTASTRWLAADLAPGAVRTPATSAPCLESPAPEPPPYYSIKLVPTRRVLGTGLATGLGEVTFASSPFGIAIAPDGSYLLDVQLTVSGLKPPSRGAYVAWFTTPELDKISRVGTLEDASRIRGRTAWNKFLVVVTLEDVDDPAQTVWAGPVVLRGMSRSGMMHTMAGHGPFEQENCATYGYS